MAVELGSHWNDMAENSMPVNKKVYESLKPKTTIKYVFKFNFIFETQTNYYKFLPFTEYVIRV